MTDSLFSQSEQMKQEYCATIVRIGEVKAIEGSDFLGVTLVNGIEVVVRLALAVVVKSLRTRHNIVAV